MKILLIAHKCPGILVSLVCGQRPGGTGPCRGPPAGVGGQGTGDPANPAAVPSQAARAGRPAGRPASGWQPLSGRLPDPAGPASPPAAGPPPRSRPPDSELSRALAVPPEPLEQIMCQMFKTPASNAPSDYSITPN